MNRIIVLVVLTITIVFHTSPVNSTNTSHFFVIVKSFHADHIEEIRKPIDECRAKSIRKSLLDA